MCCVIFLSCLYSVNANLDLIVSGAGLLKAMGTSPQPPKLFEVLNEDKDISHLLAYSMESCLAVERFFTDLDRFKEIVKIASKDSLKHEVCIVLNDIFREASIMSTPLIGATVNCPIDGGVLISEVSYVHMSTGGLSNGAEK